MHEAKHFEKILTIILQFINQSTVLPERRNVKFKQNIKFDLVWFLKFLMISLDET